MIDIHLLGPPRVEVDGALAVFDTRKAVALLAFLALSDLPRPRDLLADLLWAEGDSQHGRAALRRTLSAIRSGTDDGCLDADRSTVALRRRPDLRVDVRRVRQAVADGDLELAASLHDGDFLEGLVVAGAPAFEQWHQTTAEALRVERGALLRRLASVREDRGDLAGALDAARRWLALDDLHEPAHQAVIRLAAVTGDRSGALARYRDCVRVLDTELGVAPLAATTALYEAVRNDAVAARTTGPALAAAVPAPAPAPAPATSVRVVRSPLVGRDAVLAALLAAHRGTTASGRVVVLQGEAGIGKTRLVDELVTRLEAGGAVALTARAFREESSLSYAPVVQALRARLLRDERWCEQLSENARAAVGRLVPELLPTRAPGRPPAPSGPEAPGAEERFLAGLWETVATAAAGSSGNAAGLVVLDDAHVADEATSALLAYGSRRLQGRRLLLVLTWRTPSESPLHPVVVELERAGDAVVHPLGRLGADDVAAVTRALRPEAAEPAVVRRLHVETEGVPFLVVEYLRELDLSAPRWSLPGSVRALMRTRLAQVSEVGRQLLAAAAVLGRSVDVDVVRATSGRAEDEVVTGLEELTRHGLVREDGQGYDFTHETLRTLVQEDTSLARRRLLHRRAAEATDDPGVQARHLEQAGDAAAAAAAHLRAAARARSVFAHVQALSHLRAALALGHPDAAVIEVEAADLLTLLGDYAAAAASLERAAATADDPRLLGTIEHRLGQVHHRSGSWTLAQAHLAEALVALDPRDPHEAGARARVTADLSLAVLSAGEPGRAHALAVEALAAAGAAADVQAQAQANNLLGLLASRDGDMRAAVAHLETSLTLAADAEDGSARVAALNNLALAHRDAGELDAAAARTREALRLCTELGDRHRQAALHNNLADLLHARGDAEEAMGQLKRAVALFADVGAVAGEGAEIWKLVQW